MKNDIKHIHMILQGKGGVGKSFIATLIAQYFLNLQKTISCVDTDPVNATFSGYKTLKVIHLKILDEGDNINVRNFDKLIEGALNSKKQHIIVDNGASSFVPLSSYLIDNKVSELFSDKNHVFTIHTVLVGGSGLMDTLNGFNQLVKQFSVNTRFIVWINPFLGKVIYDGKNFENMNVYLHNKERIFGIVYMPEFVQETSGYDIRTLQERKMLFSELNGSDVFGIMAKQRLSLIERDFFEKISLVLGNE